MNLTTTEKVSIAVGVVSGIIFGVYKMSDGANPVLSSNSVAPIPALQSSSAKFAIGKYNGNYGQGWRRATAADWTNPAFQAALVQAHREGGGWPLLEEPLECNGVLYVDEGFVQIDGNYVSEVGFTNGSQQQLRGVYPAMNWDTSVAWTTREPALGKNWSVIFFYLFDAKYNPPCLFVRNQVSSAGKKTRRHKKSKTKKYGKGL